MKHIRDFTDSQIAAARRNVEYRLGQWVRCGLCGWECKWGTGRLFRDWFGKGDLMTCLICKNIAAKCESAEQAVALLMAQALGGMVDNPGEET